MLQNVRVVIVAAKPVMGFMNMTAQVVKPFIVLIIVKLMEHVSVTMDILMTEIV